MNPMWILFNKMRMFVTILIARSIYSVIQIFHLGNGYTWPGHIALKLYPDIFFNYRNSFKQGIFFISGTNGKTTTSKLISHILSSKGFKVLTNQSGANLLNGIASSLVLNTPLLGKFSYDVAIFEVDEFALPRLMQKLTPKALVLLNLSRDQLDRYGEVDTIVEKWNAALSLVAHVPSLILDATQAVFSPLIKSHKGNIFYFDADTIYLKHTGLLGDFNAKNINAALTVCALLGISKDASITSLKDFDAAYGRGEVLEFKNMFLKLFLAKNPASFNNNLSILVKNEIIPDALLFVLNDNIPDGRDVSWIYDIDPVALASACSNKKIFISGTRALDMAIRLKYAGVTFSDRSVAPALDAVMELMNEANVREAVILPNYSAMLSLRGLVTGRKIL